MTNEKSKKKTLFTIARIGLAFGILMYLIKTEVITWSAVAATFANPTYPLIAFVSCLLLSALGALRWMMIVRAQGFSLSLWKAIQLVFIGTFFDACMPGATGGDVIRAAYISKGQTGRRVEAVMTVFLDRTTGLFALFLFFAIVLSFSYKQIWPHDDLRHMAKGIIYFVLGTFVVLGTMFSPWVANSKFLHSSRNRNGMTSRIYDSLHLYRKHPRVLFISIGISLACHFLCIFSLYLISQAQDVVTAQMVIEAAKQGATLTETYMQKVPMAPHFILSAFGLFVNSIPLTPGGLGVGEKAFDTLFRLYEITDDNGVKVACSGGAAMFLSFRIVIYLRSMVGAVFLMLHKHEIDDIIHEAEDEEDAV